MASKLLPDPINQTDIEEYLNDYADFSFELRVLKELVDLKLQCQHGGTYDDPITGKSREFDSSSLSSVTFTHKRPFHTAVLFLASGAAQEISGLLIIFGVGLIFISAIKKRQRNYHVWVECKNLGKKVNRDQINKLQTTTDRLKRNPDADWKPDFVLCFSATDFERDALAIARQHGIVCYRRSGNGFREVT